MTAPDCTCHGFHTDDVDRGINDETIRVLIQMETCPVEKRALTRILASR